MCYCCVSLWTKPMTEWVLWSGVFRVISMSLGSHQQHLHRHTGSCIVLKSVNHLSLLQMRREGAMEVRTCWCALATCICSKKWPMWQLHDQDLREWGHRAGSVIPLSRQAGTVPATPQVLLLETWSFLKFSKRGLKLFLVFSVCVYGLYACEYECSHVYLPECACWGKKLMVGVFFNYSPCYLLRQVWGLLEILWPSTIRELNYKKQEGNHIHDNLFNLAGSNFWSLTPGILFQTYLNTVQLWEKVPW